MATLKKGDLTPEIRALYAEYVRRMEEHALPAREFAAWLKTYRKAQTAKPKP